VALWARFFGSAGSQAVGVAMGAAAVPPLIPYAQDLTNAAWHDHQSHPILASILAEGVAKGKVDYTWAQTEATYTGFKKERFDVMVAAAKTGPGLATAMELWRRSSITDAEFAELLGLAGTQAKWIPHLESLKLDLLDPTQVAAAIHRGLIPDPGLLQGQQPEPPFTVPAYPVYPISAVDEAAGHGISKDRLGVMVGLQGLPMGPVEAANAYFRGIITHGDYIRAFNESNNRNEWAEAVLGYAKQIPTARDYIENALRGYRTLAKAQEGAARHGMSPEDALLIFQNAGRPLNLHQITQALAWDGKYNPAPADNPDPYRQAVLLGAVRPEYYDLQEHLKYNLPSAFFFRVLQQQDVLTESEAVTWYKRLGWPQELADKVAAAFAKTSTGSGTSYVDKAKTQLWNTTHRTFIAGETTEDDALESFAAIGVPQDERQPVLDLWELEAQLTRKQLTPAQLKKAFTGKEVNPATGAAWTRDEVLARLVGMGYSPNDASTFLDL